MSPTSRPRVAGLSLDLDDLWTYLRTHGDDGWSAFPTYLPLVVPRILKMLAERGLRPTIFLVGRDAADPRHQGLLRQLAEGCEIGNHSFLHEPWLHLYRRDELAAEIERAELAIEEATGTRPSAFRGPGFSLSRTVLEVLVERGYRYDASLFPTYLGPLARAYYLRTARLGAAAKARRARLFGRLGDGRRPIAPFYWRLGEARLLELPVTTLPILKLPFHMSYLLYAGGFSPALARHYLRAALRLCDLTGTVPTLLLHPLDFLGADDCPELAFFPAMGQPADVKLRRTGRLLDIFKSRHRVLPLGELAEQIRQQPLAERRPDFLA